MMDRKIEQSVIFKVQIKYFLSGSTLCDEFMNFLITKKCLAGSPHPDYDICLALYFGKRVPSGDEFRQFPFMEIINEL